MTQLSYYRTDPRGPLPRPAGLVLWGWILTVVGSLISSFFVLGLVFTAVQIFSPGRSIEWAIGTLLHLASYGLWGTVIILTGIGSFRLRRWVAPLIFGASAASAVLNTVLLAQFLNMLMYRNALYYNPIIVILLLLAYGLPGAACIYFSRSSVRDVLATNDPARNDLAWQPVRSGDDFLTAWSAGCMLFAITSFVTGVSLQRYAMPLASIYQCLYALMAVAGFACYRRIHIGWVGTVVIAGLLLILQSLYLASFLGLHTGLLPVSTVTLTLASRHAGTPAGVNAGLTRSSLSWWINFVISTLRLSMYFAALGVGVFVGRSAWPDSSPHPPRPVTADAE